MKQNLTQTHVQNRPNTPLIKKGIAMLAITLQAHMCDSVHGMKDIKSVIKSLRGKKDKRNVSEDSINTSSSNYTSVPQTEPADMPTSSSTNNHTQVYEQPNTPGYWVRLQSSDRLEYIQPGCWKYVEPEHWEHIQPGRYKYVKTKTSDYYKVLDDYHKVLKYSGYGDMPIFLESVPMLLPENNHNNHTCTAACQQSTVSDRSTPLPFHRSFSIDSDNESPCTSLSLPSHRSSSIDSGNESVRRSCTPEQYKQPALIPSSPSILRHNRSSGPSPRLEKSMTLPTIQENSLDSIKVKSDDIKEKIE